MMDANAVLQGFLSVDAARIRGAAFAVLYAKHDAAKLAPLLPYADNIVEATRTIELGGVFIPNRLHVKEAVAVLRFYAQNFVPCSCQLFLSQYEWYSPEHEVALGAISILGIQKIQEKWVDYYHCQCTRCQQEFRVSEGEGHCLWWHWQRWS